MSRPFLFTPFVVLACLPAFAAGLTSEDLGAMLQSQDAASIVQNLDSGAYANNA